MDQDLAGNLALYLQRLQPDLASLRVENVKRFFGGSSKPTYRADMLWMAAGATETSGIVVRTTPDRSLVDHHDDIEPEAIRMAGRHGLPVPRLIALETDPSHIGSAFFIMQEVAGCESSSRALATPHYQLLRDKIGGQKWRILGQLAAITLSDEERSRFPPVTIDTSWVTELGKWERYYHENAQEYEPMVEYALRWLRETPPPVPEKLSLVHGDYRTGNFLFDRDGDIKAVLDWEMAHIGDPMEDIGWAICRLWGWPDRDRPGHLIAKRDAFAIWEAASGMRIDPAALKWWSVLGAVKGMALWAAMGRKVVEENSTVSMDYSASWFPYDGHLRELLDQLLPEPA